MRFLNKISYLTTNIYETYFEFYFEFEYEIHQSVNINLRTLYWPFVSIALSPRAKTNARQTIVHTLRHRPEKI